MKESKFFKKTAAEHDKEHHKTGTPDVHPNDDHAHKSTPHEDEKHNRKEQNFPKERGETKMKITTAPTFSVLALAVLFVFGFVPASKAADPGFKFAEAKDISDKSAKQEIFDFKPSTFEASETGDFSFDLYYVKVFNTKADDFGKSCFTAVTFKKSNPDDFGAKSKDAEFKQTKFQTAEFKTINFEKENWKVNDSKKDASEKDDAKG